MAVQQGLLIMLISTGWRSKKSPAGGFISAQLMTKPLAELADVKTYHKVVLLLPGFEFYQTRLMIWLWGLVTQEWVWETGQSLRRALSLPLSLSEIYLQTAPSAGFHVTPLWTAKLTSLCIIANCITKKRMKGASILWLWVGDEGSGIG